MPVSPGMPFAVTRTSVPPAPVVPAVPVMVIVSLPAKASMVPPVAHR